MSFLQFAVGLCILFFGAEYMVRGAVALADRLGVSPAIVGMTVVAIGTSAPELTVSLVGAFSGSSELALGNIVGSNIANVLLILGVVGLFRPFAAERLGGHLDVSVLMGGTVLFIWLFRYPAVGFWPGILLLIVFAAFLGLSLRHGLNRPPSTTEPERKRLSVSLAWVLVAGGLAGVLFGADLLVEGAVALARDSGIPEAVIGLSLVAVGTSVPELAASLVAAMRGHNGMVLGNLVGSSLFNILAITGAVAALVPLTVPASITGFDMAVMLLSTALLALLLMGVWRLRRGGAAMLLASYGAYVAVRTLNGEFLTGV